jgi:hypothetical protein
VPPARTQGRAAWLEAGYPALRLADVEFRSFSQNGEDGILHYLFALLGTTNKRAVEICAGDGLECNSANLIINHGWTALLVDGDAAAVARGQRLYAMLADTWLAPPTFVPAWVTAENVNALLRAQGTTGEVDLLSVDVDGNDYGIWRAIDTIRPRVVVLEYHSSWSAARAVSIPYDPAFHLDVSRTPYYCGASLAAFVALGRTKGYRLIGAERHAVNAFFLRADVGPTVFPEVPVAHCVPEPDDTYDLNCCVTTTWPT